MTSSTLDIKEQELQFRPQDRHAQCAYVSLHVTMGLSLDVDHARDSQYRNALFQSKHTGFDTHRVGDGT